jgi:hypothetical protein
MKTYGRADVEINAFLTSVLVCEWSTSRSSHFNPGTRWIGGCLGPMAGLEDVEKRIFLTLQGLDLRPLARPARSQSLYRLRYPGSSESKIPPINVTKWRCATSFKLWPLYLDRKAHSTQCYKVQWMATPI